MRRSLLLVACALASLGIDTPELRRVSGPHPLRSLVEEWLTDELDLRACYEGAPHPTGTWSVGVDPTAADPLAAAVDASNRSTFPVRFRVATVGARRVAVADAVLGPDGRWESYTPLLDTPIDLPPAERTVAQAVSEWASALHEATGVELIKGPGFDHLPTDASGAQRPARDVLADILDDQSRNIVWSLTPAGPNRWTLHVRGVWGLVETEVPANYVPPPMDGGDEQRVLPDGTVLRGPFEP